MAEDPNQSAADPAAGALTDIEIAVIRRLGLEDALNGAREEARNSRLPGLARGPANAYQHLLISGELWRRLGPIVGPLAAAAHELGNNWRRDQLPKDADMDGHNNGIVANEGPEFNTWEDVVRWARGKFSASAPHDGDGEDGRALWLDKQPADWRPNFQNVPITPIEKGGFKHRFGVMTAGAEPSEAAERPAARVHPLDRPVATWTEQDVRTVLNAPAYRQPQHARRQEAQRMVRAWFEQRFGTGPARADATGRPVRAGETIARSGGSYPVPVRAHTRDGGKVEVSAHCRTNPAV